MDFGEAIRKMREERKVTGGTLADGAWVVLMPALDLPAFSTQAPGTKVNDRTRKHIGADTPLHSQPYFALWTPDGRWHPGWVPSQADMLASNWRVVE